MSVTLLAVGDIMLGDSPVCDGFGVGSLIRKHGPSFPFQQCNALLNSGDILFGNLEVVISAYDRSKVSFEESIFRGQPESISGLKEAGFDIVGLATNHTMQHGQKPLEECVALLQKAGIGVTGISCDRLKIPNLHVIESGGLKIGFLAYNLRPQQYFIDPPCWDLPTPEQMIAEITRVRTGLDHLILSLHWGHEFIDYPSPEQVELGHRLIDAGVSVILGHHPHIVQGVESYKNGLIAYSLGNFVFDMWQERFCRTLILRVVFDGSGKIQFDIIPVEINSQWQPVPLEGSAADQWRAGIEALGRKISATTSMTDYRTELRQAEERYRQDVKSWYLQNMFRYRPSRLIANFGRSVTRRLNPKR